MIEDLETQTHEPLEIINEASDKYKRKEFWVLCSGGKDSVSLADWLDKQGMLTGVMHIQTNCGIRQNGKWIATEFVKELCDQKKWKLKIEQPNEPYWYVAHCLEHGFPTRKNHKLIMGFLKYHTMRRFAFEPERKEKCCLVSGVRKRESIRRMGNYKKPIQKDGNLYFCMPFFYKSTQWVYRYFLENNLRRSPVYDFLEFSGECECGCFAEKYEAKMLKQIYPETTDFFEWLEEGVRRFGNPLIKTEYLHWGNRASGIETIEDQKTMEEFAGIDEIENLVCGVECRPSQNFEPDQIKDDTEKFIKELDTIDEKIKNNESF